jgi:circadian clock protein KaiB
VSAPGITLRLYVDDESTHALRAIAELEAIRRQYLGSEADVQVIDIRADPDVAEREHLLAVPALVRVAPAPVRRIVGDLSDHAAVRSALELGRAETLR